MPPKASLTLTIIKVLFSLSIKSRDMYLLSKNISSDNNGESRVLSTEKSARTFWLIVVPEYIS
jgi:hypothetical protein